MAKVRALITLVVGSGQEIAPNTICEVSDAEAKRLVSIGFAEKVKKENTQNSGQAKQQTEGTADDGKEDDDQGGGQPVQPTGTDGNVQG